MTTLKERLQQVLNEKRVASERAWSDAAGLAPAAVNKLLTREGAAEERAKLQTVTALAHAAGVSPAWLAYGIGGPDDDPPFATLIMRLSRMPGIQEVLERHPGRWRVSTIARATSTPFQSDERGIPIGGWEKALDTLELGRTTEGDADEVARETARQVGKRPRLPPLR